MPDEAAPLDPQTSLNEAPLEAPSLHSKAASEIALEDKAMRSLKRPPLSPLLPMIFYMILTSSATTMVQVTLPRQRKEYFGSDATAALWTCVCESIAASIGFFTSGIFGLVSDAYGRKFVLIVSAVVMLVSYAIQAIFGPYNPWPFLVASNFSTLIGSTPIGNAALGFAVIADLYSKEERLFPSIVYVVSLFAGAMLSPIPSVAGLSAETTSIMASVVLFLVLVFVFFFFEETLPAEKRKKVALSTLENPLVPLRYVFRDRYLLSFAALSFSFFFPFNVAIGIDLYYFGDKLENFTDTDNGLLMLLLALSFLVEMAVLAPLVVQRARPIVMVLIGVTGMTFNAVIHTLVAEKWLVFAFVPCTLALAFVALPTTSQMVSVTVPANELGLVNGTIAAVKGLATVLGPVLGAVLLSVGEYQLGFVQLPFVVASVVSAAGFLVLGFGLKPILDERERLALTVEA